MSILAVSCVILPSMADGSEAMTRAGSPDHEAALVERARAGDRAAFDRLVEAHLPRVWRVVWRIVRDDADDVVQEVFLTAWRSIGQFRGEARFSTWLHHIAATRALNHLDRTEERAKRRSQSLDDELGEPLPFASPAPNPLQELEAQELQARLAECMERLPAAFRAVVALRDGEDMAYEDIARCAGLPIGTVRSRLARARLALKDCLEGRRR